MRPLVSQIETTSSNYKKNFEAMSLLLAQHEELLAASIKGGGEKYVARHIDAGKLLPRERIELLLDRDSWFLELMPFAGHDVGANLCGAGLIGGIGLVSGVECVIIANESTVKGGAISGIGVKKGLRLAEVALENGLPTVHLTESAGGDLADQSEVFVAGGKTFRNITRQSKEKLPTICEHWHFTV